MPRDERHLVASSMVGANKEPFKGVTMQTADSSVDRALAHIAKSREKYTSKRTVMDMLSGKWLEK